MRLLARVSARCAKSFSMVERLFCARWFLPRGDFQFLRLVRFTIGASTLANMQCVTQTAILIVNHPVQLGQLNVLLPSRVGFVLGGSDTSEKRHLPDRTTARSGGAHP
ncbi:hypothetical protein GUJ93_ZPchr0003g16737 [Zizania palustris]|uniref:Uncharacterized protein n=1 Tax=Zizania palustris TaxID=103762 RepID=A0A8J5SSP8_ZIZPA|nr:hypothetical protein GUJ93_ZPchr0003g16737 [Zizania palustris]